MELIKNKITDYEEYRFEKIQLTFLYISQRYAGRVEEHDCVVSLNEG